MSDNEKQVTVHLAANLSEAEIVKSVLDGYKIESWILDEEALTTMEGILAPSEQGIHVMTQQEDAERAKQALKEARETGRVNFEQRGHPGS
ncbi:MAG: hypothetical protein RL885_11185 [Planctomycetota bacterium]